ncbi:hypothetical protein ACIRPK_20410 [Kitasatospora sp. NPDC101801]|uniref:hypothetical protein n=1 Tax=Kitasatospora sp. NPDC101801 TaxID=3364103 RepID=UPI0038296F6C
MESDDGPYVTFEQLTKLGQRHFIDRASLQVAEAKPATLEEEAAIYLLVNGGGTPHTDADLDKGSRVAHQGSPPSP